MRRRAARIGLLALPMLAMFGLAAYAAWSAWTSFDAVEIGVHGIVAMALGVVFTLGLTGLLLWLMRYSQRKGYDQQH